MLTVSQLTKSYAGRVLFQEASLQVNAGDRVGLIGANGAGKSTLFSLILGDSSPDAGIVSLQRGVTLGFLPQESAPCGDETILDLAMSVSQNFTAVLNALREHSSEDSDEHHDAIARFADMDGYNLEARAKRVLAGLAFREGDFGRPARTMSGGWVMRAHLARLLVMEPDILMLDEPTNHLDLETLGWFQNYLVGYPGAILAISHDRAFLNTICQSVVEISRQRLNRYTGNFDDFLSQKLAREQHHLAAYKNQQREIAHLEEFVNRFRAKATKASQAQERLKRLEKMDRLDAPQGAEASVRFSFPQPARSGQRVMVLDRVRQLYGQHVVYENLNLTVERGQRTVLVGPNGAGKSTLIKILAGYVDIDAGERLPGHNVSIGYFAQHRIETLNVRRTVLEEALAEGTGIGEQAARAVLGSFLFRGDDVFKSVSVLSGGEKSRLALVKLLLRPPNLLLMDEPTTHLDMPSIDALIQALQQYKGTLVFISHDVHFIRSIASTVLHINAGRLTPYPGDYDYYLEKSNASSERDALVSPLSGSQTAKQSVNQRGKDGILEIRKKRRQETERNQAVTKERRAREKELAQLEAAVLRLEAKQKELATQLEDPRLYTDPAKPLALNRELSSVTLDLEMANAAWLDAAEALSTRADLGGAR
ncbi:MAG TPA: ABC-F family ATP-binding cassette domain-containing protein [Terrimicrobiaceae bacterium]